MKQESINISELEKNSISKPLVLDQFTAAPSAHVFVNKIYKKP